MLLSETNKAAAASKKAPAKGKAKTPTAGKKPVAKKKPASKKPAKKKNPWDDDDDESAASSSEGSEYGGNDDEDMDADESKQSIEQIYQKKTQLEHILLRPDTYGKQNSLLMERLASPDLTGCFNDLPRFVCHSRIY
jgi:DNA topoisomerase-2